LLYTALD